MQTVYTCSGGGSGSQQREVADRADVVLTDTDANTLGHQHQAPQASHQPVMC